MLYHESNDTGTICLCIIIMVSAAVLLICVYITLAVGGRIIHPAMVRCNDDEKNR